MTVIKMMDITIASFHRNLHANKSYLLNIDPPETLLTPQLKNPGNALLAAFGLNTLFVN